MGGNHDGDRVVGCVVSDSGGHAPDVPIQLLVAAVLGAGVWIAASWSKIKKIFKKGKTDEETDDDNDADVQS